MAFGYTIFATLEVFLVPVDNLVGYNGLFFSEKVLEVIIFILASENQINKTYLINDTKDQRGLKK